ncbi:MAG: elongation factor G, partial [bacterium]
EGGELKEPEIQNGLKSGIINGKIVPVVFSIPTLNIGTDLLLDSIVDYLPHPIFNGYTMVKRDKDGEPEEKLAIDGPTTLFFFRTLTEAKLGEISFFKLYSGKLTPGIELYNPVKQGFERIGQIYLLNGRDRQETPCLYAGDIGGTVRLKITQTNDTLTVDKNNPVIIPPIEFPHPVINMGLEPKNKGEEDKIGAGLSRLHEEEPTFSFVVDPELKQTIIYGQGELQLELIVRKLKERYGVEVELTRPKIPYRETIRKKAEAQGKYKRQTGGRGQYGDCWLRLEPLPRGSGFEFVDAIVGGVIPSKYIPSIEKGVREVMESGILTNQSKVTDVKVTVFDGSYHEVDSSDIAFKIAGSMGFKNAFMQAEPVLLEPIYNVYVVVPEEFMGDIIGDISARRGRILGMETVGNYKKIIAQVPLAELYKYSTTLRSLTQGRG